MKLNPLSYFRIPVLARAPGLFLMTLFSPILDPLTDTKPIPKQCPDLSANCPGTAAGLSAECRSIPLPHTTPLLFSGISNLVVEAGRTPENQIFG